MAAMKFFVYGAMSEGLVHFEKIKEFITDKRAACTVGKAFRLKVGFPVFLEGGEDVVPGDLVTLNATELLIQLLDEFHGLNQLEPAKSLYFRREIKVKTPEIECDAWTYVLNPAKLPKNAVPISGGNWIESLRAEPALISSLSEKQRDYIAKLGMVKGREIIPINDLALYRELVKLDLIVDKGRRLALSKLGHEVFRYLG